MKVQIIVFGVLLIIGNVSFASQEVVIQTQQQQKNSLNNSTFDIHKDIMQYLIDNGLEYSTAKKLSYSSNEIPKHKVNILLSQFKEIKYDELVGVLAKRVLHKKSVNLENNDTLMAIVHTLKGPNISKEVRNNLLAS